MQFVEHLLDSKGHDAWCINPDSSVFDAIQLMSEKEVGALLVTEQDQLVGIVTERDYARKVILKDRSSKQTPIKDIMVTSVLIARPEQTVEECMALMTDKRVRHLPVLKGDRVDGIVSMGDLVKAIIADQKFTIEQLEHYISG